MDKGAAMTVDALPRAGSRDRNTVGLEGGSNSRPTPGAE